MAAGGVLSLAGMALLVVSDGRLGLATSLVAVAAGLALTVIPSSPAEAAALFLAGLGAAAVKTRAGLPGWRILPPRSTPRFILAAVGLPASLLGYAALTARGGIDLAGALSAPAVPLWVVGMGRLLVARELESVVAAAAAALLSAAAAAFGAGAVAAAATLLACCVLTCLLPVARR